MSKFLGIFVCDGHISQDHPPVILDEQADVELVLEDDVVNSQDWDEEDDQLVVYEILEDGTTKQVSSYQAIGDGPVGTYGWVPTK